ncbi:MAG: hypothetical protein AAF363_02700 [Bacteroidota bacterium]
MKRIVFIALINCALIQFSFSQSSWEAGIRLSSDDGQPGSQISIDATVPVGLKPRLHPTIYLGDGGIGFAGYFDWLFNLEGTPKNLKFYPGIGPELFFFDDFVFGIAGNFGVEYSFDFPITVGFDWRPGFRLGDNVDTFDTSNWGIMARFNISKFSPAR